MKYNMFWLEFIHFLDRGSDVDRVMILMMLILSYVNLRGLFAGNEVSKN